MTFYRRSLKLNRSIYFPILYNPRERLIQWKEAKMSFPISINVQYIACSNINPPIDQWIHVFVTHSALSVCRIFFLFISRYNGIVSTTRNFSIFAYDFFHVKTNEIPKKTKHTIIWAKQKYQNALVIRNKWFKQEMIA